MGSQYADRGRKVMKNYYTYIKIALVVLLLGFIVFDMRRDPISNAQIDTVEKAVVSVSDFKDASSSENRMVRRFYGLNPKDYEGAILYAPSDNMDAKELFLIKLTDVSQSEAVQDAIEERLDTQKKSFEGYGAEQTKLLNDHVLEVKGNYILYYVGGNTSKVRQAFLDSL